jgi:hypothetical protein
MSALEARIGARLQGVFTCIYSRGKKRLLNSIINAKERPKNPALQERDARMMVTRRLPNQTAVRRNPLFTAISGSKSYSVTVKLMACEALPSRFVVFFLSVTCIDRKSVV